MTWPIVGIALFSANISSSTLVGLASDGFQTNISVYNYEWYAVVILIFFSIFFLPFYLKSGVYTMPEFLERRYDSRSRYYFSGITIVGNVLIDTQSDFLITTNAKSSATGGSESVGVGGSVALSFIDLLTRSELDGSASLTNVNNLTVTVDSTRKVTTYSEGGASGGIAITPALSLSDVKHTAEAIVDSGSALTLSGNLSVEATHDGIVEVIADAAVGGTEVLVGATLAINEDRDITSALLNRDVDSSNTISVVANSTQVSLVESKAGANGATFSVSVGDGNANESGGDDGAGDVGGDNVTGGNENGGNEST